MNAGYPPQFGPFAGRVWFNCAHQGPLPRAAVAAAEEAIQQKMNPHLIKDEAFVAIPSALRTSLAGLIGGASEDIILGNSASYGLHVLRNGMHWHGGDEVLVVHGDFPATIYPWLGLRDDGVRVRILTPLGLALTTDELAQEITSSTRLLCVSWVNSFNGSVLDLSAIGQLCRDRGIIFVVNGSQGVGAQQINVQRQPMDALVCCGYKWLCGPYGTGFCWLRPELRDQLKPSQTYWLPQVWGQENLTNYELKDIRGSAAFDVFCTANFMNFMPWRASIEFLLSVGIATIEEHNHTLVAMLVNEISKTKYRLASSSHHTSQSAIVAISHVSRERNPEICTSLSEAGIDIALRNGDLRFSPHLYNTADDVSRAVSLLNSLD